LSDSLGFALAVMMAEIVPAAIALYAAYWAFAIRRALAGRIYRNHAFWLGVVCILFAAVSFAVPLTYTNNAIIRNAIGVFYLVLNPVVFAFIDSTVRVARRSDPLLRSILRWDKLRIALWIDEIVLTIVLALNFVPSIVSSVPQVEYLFPALLAIAYIAGAPALLIGAKRSRDTTLRQSLKWLGVAFMMLFAYIVYDVIIQLIIPGISEFDRYYSYPAVLGGIIGILLSYALYRSARSLAPINRMSLEVAPKVEPPPP
jgi:hypothetical protein